jgi:hypothetical protein
MIDVSVSGKTPELFQKLEAAVSRIIRAHAEATAEMARSLMRGAPRPSLAGGPPAVRSGKYLESIGVIRENSLEAKVGASAEYAAFVEKERPLWGMALKEVLPTLEERLARELAAI